MPEFLKTIIGQVNNMAMLSPEAGAKTSLFCAIDPTLDSPAASGKYYDNCKEVWTSWLARDRDMATRLWQVSRQIVQLD